jgi:hypothetical protein
LFKSLDDRDSGLALPLVERVNGTLLRQLSTYFPDYPLNTFRACLENIASVAPNFRLGKWFQRSVQARFQFSKPGARKPSERNIARTARKRSDPRLTGRANPHRAMIFAIRIGLVAGTSKHGGRTAVIAIGVGQGFDRSSDAHLRILTSGNPNISNEKIRHPKQWWQKTSRLFLA